MSRQPKVVTFDAAAIIERFGCREALDRFHTLLMEENSRVNLVSRETSRADFDRMAAECLLPLELLDGDARPHSYLDIGAGGGFPLFPISFAERFDRIAACERTQKKASAIIRMAKELELDITVTPRTFEDVRFESTFALITLRYVKLTPPLLKGIMHTLENGGVFVYYSDPSFSIDHFAIRRFCFQTSTDQPLKHFCLLARK
ncbi:class I SAM-dependent methyltransferase [bacterium]|nr:class I SAM-dependent methyltransferase [bacterium]